MTFSEAVWKRRSKLGPDSGVNVHELFYRALITALSRLMKALGCASYRMDRSSAPSGSSFVIDPRKRRADKARLLLGNGPSPRL